MRTINFNIDTIYCIKICALKIIYINPTKIEVEIPYTNTGPATVNILAPTPITYPSDLNSIAGATIEFAKPVIGTREPAPAILPILLKILSPVKNALIAIKIIETTVPEEVSSKPLYLQKEKITCPIEQISPPIKNAFIQFFNIGELGDFLSTYSW